MEDAVHRAGLRRHRTALELRGRRRPDEGLPPVLQGRRRFQEHGSVAPRAGGARHRGRLRLDRGGEQLRDGGGHGEARALPVFLLRRGGAQQLCKLPV